MKKSFILFLVLFFSLSAAHAMPNRSRVEKILGRKGIMLPGGVFKVPFPRSNLSVKIGGIRLEPAFALNSWVAFKDNGKSAMIMGDFCLLQNEIEPVIKKLSSGGIRITALHNHLLWETPTVMFIHIEGTGDPVKLAGTVRQALLLTGTPPNSTSSGRIKKSTSWSTVETILRLKGMEKGNLLLLYVPRNGIAENSTEIPPAMGAGDVINFQKTGNRVATTGDFALLADEVNPVMNALLRHGIFVTAIHSHMLFAKPHLFYLHWWGIGKPEQMAQGIKSALDKAGVKP